MNEFDFKTAEEYVDYQKKQGISENEIYRNLVDLIGTVGLQEAQNLINKKRSVGVPEREIYQEISRISNQCNVIGKSNAHLRNSIDLDDDLINIAANAANKGRRNPYGRR